MPDFVTDISHPNWVDIPNEQRTVGTLAIEGTRGLWVRKNFEEDTLEIWFDGKFQAAWEGAEIIENRLQTLMRFTYEMGLERGKQENQRKLREALGLVAQEKD